LDKTTRKAFFMSPYLVYQCSSVVNIFYTVSRELAT
jgi:hypothetical protein